MLVKNHLLIKQYCSLKKERLTTLESALPKIELTVILPAHNEAPRIINCLRRVEQAVATFSKLYEIIIAEDGSTDGTNQIVANIARKNHKLRVLHSNARLGKGRAIKNALHLARGNVIVFMDVDLSTGLDSLQGTVQLAAQQDGLVIGSRYIKGAKVQRPLRRTVFSLIYNLFVRVLFLDSIRDHQCGFKAMTHRVSVIIRDYVKANGFFFDTEMILLCKKLLIPVIEVPVEWVENKKSSESLIKPFREGIKMCMDLLMYRLKFSGETRKVSK